MITIIPAKQFNNPTGKMMLSKCSSKDKPHETINQNHTKLTAVPSTHSETLANSPPSFEALSPRQFFTFFKNSLNKKSDLSRIRNLANQKKHDKLNQIKDSKYSASFSETIKKSWNKMGGSEHDLIGSNITMMRINGDYYTPMLDNHHSQQYSYPKKEVMNFNEVMSFNEEMSLLLIADYRVKYNLSHFWYANSEQEAITLIDTILSNPATIGKYAILFQYADGHNSSLLLEKESGTPFKLWVCGSVHKDIEIDENDSLYINNLLNVLPHSTQIQSGCTLYFSYPNRQSDSKNCFLFALSSCKHFLLNANISINKIYSHDSTVRALSEIGGSTESQATAKKVTKGKVINCVSVVLPPEMMKITQSITTILKYANYLENTENKFSFLSKVREKCFVLKNRNVFALEDRSIKNVQIAFKKYTKLELLRLFAQVFTTEELNELRLIQKFPKTEAEFEKTLTIIFKYEHFLLAENLLSLDSYHSEMQKTALQNLINNKISDPIALKNIFEQSDELLSECEQKITI